MPSPGQNSFPTSSWSQWSKLCSFPLQLIPLTTLGMLPPPKSSEFTAEAAYFSPSCLQATMASRTPHPSPQTTPHSLLSNLTSILPSIFVLPPLTLISMFLATCESGRFGFGVVVVVVVLN